MRTQIQLAENRYDDLRRIAFAKRVSLSEIIRRAIDEVYPHGKRTKGPGRYDKALKIAGKFKDVRTDTALEHDRYAFAEKIHAGRLR